MANENELEGPGGAKRPLADVDNASDGEYDSRKSARKDEEEIIKGAWSPEEDEVMKRAVDKLGMDWKAVATMVKGRTSKQCRDRYKLKLDPTINHGPWSPEEDQKLIELHSQLGRQWTKIAKLMEGRTENSVKSRFASLDRSRKREWTDEEDLILRKCREQNLDYVDIAQSHLPKRSEHAIKKRWERLFMRDLAKKIRNELPGNGAEDMGLSGAVAGMSSSNPYLGGVPPSAAAAASHAMGMASAYHPPQQQQQQQQRPLGPPMYASSTSSDAHMGAAGQHLSPAGQPIAASQLQQQQQQYTPPPAASSSSSSSPPSLLLGGPMPHPGPVHRTGSEHQVSEVLGTMLDQGQDADFPKLRKRLTAESITSPSSMLAPASRGDHPFQFLSSNPSDSQSGAGDADASGARRVSNRSGNLKRQTTSVTILRQILPDPLP